MDPLPGSAVHRSMRQPTRDELGRLLRLWGVPLERQRGDIDLTGSPERTEWRTAVESADGSVFVLEQIAPGKRERRRRIAATLQTLADRGVPAVEPYLATVYGGTVGEMDGTYWQLMPFVEGVALPRPDYVWDEWRGEAPGRLADRSPPSRRGADLRSEGCVLRRGVLPGPPRQLCAALAQTAERACPLRAASCGGRLRRRPRLAARGVLPWRLSPDERDLGDRWPAQRSRLGVHGLQAGTLRCGQHDRLCRHGAARRPC